MKSNNEVIDMIQSKIWARIAEELQKDGVKFSIGTAYGAGQSIKEILHPEVNKLIQHALNQQREELVGEIKEILVIQKNNCNHNVDCYNHVLLYLDELTTPVKSR